MEHLLIVMVTIGSNPFVVLEMVSVMSFSAVELECRPGQRHALSPAMEDRHVLRNPGWKRLNHVMSQLAGLTLESGV